MEGMGGIKTLRKESRVRKRDLLPKESFFFFFFPWSLPFGEHPVAHSMVDLASCQSLDPNLGVILYEFAEGLSRKTIK